MYDIFLSDREDESIESRRTKPFQQILVQGMSAELGEQQRSSRFTAAEKEIISGLSAGFMVTTITHPLDVIKVRLQLDSSSKTQMESYRKIFQQLKVSNESATKLSSVARNLYRGISINIVGNTVAWGAYFSLYRFYKDITLRNISTGGLIANDSNLRSHHYLVSAYAAGFTALILTNPIWVLKTRILSTSKQYPGAYQSIADGVRRILREEGIKGFWRGLTPGLFGVLQSSIHFSIYDTLKQQLFLGSDLTVWQSIYLSAGSKICSNVALYPFQVMKSRLQNYGNRQTMTEVAASVYRIAGITGFYKGLIPNVARVLPATCITFACYEQVKNVL